MLCCGVLYAGTAVRLATGVLQRGVGCWWTEGRRSGLGYRARAASTQHYGMLYVVFCHDCFTGSGTRCLHSVIIIGSASQLHETNANQPRGCHLLHIEWNDLT
jgi:hypothetical protein